MPTPDLRFRQIHLDFHTSGDIKGIGANFDPDEYARTLKKAHVDSVTTFARCHHGYLYYQSEKHPERVHPHLARPNLLGEQIEACHKNGINAPIYITVQWDLFSADAHRDWLCVLPDGKLSGYWPMGPGFYQTLDVFHPGYRQFLFDHVDEVLSKFPTDGIFFDIVQAKPSMAPHWVAAMDRDGVNVDDQEARQDFAQKVINEWQEEMTAFVRDRNKDCTLFYNSGHIGPKHREAANSFTHWELESLPSGGWGYLHFPLAMRYARGMAGKPCLGMTGKFHTAWGDFSSYKSEQALEFECNHMLALGAQCSIGDQLPPDGKIDGPTYDLVGKAYSQVEAKEPWCTQVDPVADIAVFTPEEFPHSFEGRQPKSTMGAVRMLQELHMQFDIVSSERDLSPYKLVILPDDMPVDAKLAKKLKAFSKAGGALIASYRSGLKPDGESFALTELGVKLVGEAPYSPDFVVPGDEIVEGMKPTGHVMYLKGMEVKAAKGAQVLADVQVPYFNRTWRHFCSHRHTPSSGEIGYPGVVRKDNNIYFMHPIFRQYQANAAWWCRLMLRNAIDLLLPQRSLHVEGPTTLLAALNKQNAENRMVLHLLHYIPERRGEAFDTIFDIIPIHDIPVDLAVDGDVKSVKLVPNGKKIKHQQKAGRVTFTVPKIEGHAMIEVALA